MAHNGGTPRLLAKCGRAVELPGKQRIEDPALARIFAPNRLIPACHGGTQITYSAGG
jgi:hypothetical protein